MTLAARRRAERRGHWAERLGLWHLRLRGYRVLARRFRVPSGEIDLIVRRRGVIAAIEVKARADFATAGEAVSERQRRRIARALEHFLVFHPELSRLVLRFDVMLVAPGRWPRHIADAWRTDD